MTRTKEKTICSWCDKPISGKEINYNGEFICPECYRLHQKVKRASMKFWKGVKKHE